MITHLPEPLQCLAADIARRDHCSLDEATEAVHTAWERIHDEAIPAADLLMAEEILHSELGIEPDYLIDFLTDAPQGGRQ